MSKKHPHDATLTVAPEETLNEAPALSEPEDTSLWRGAALADPAVAELEAEAKRLVAAAMRAEDEYQKQRAAVEDIAGEEHTLLSEPQPHDDFDALHELWKPIKARYDEARSRERMLEAHAAKLRSKADDAVERFRADAFEVDRKLLQEKLIDFQSRLETVHSEFAAAVIKGWNISGGKATISGQEFSAFEARLAALATERHELLLRAGHHPGVVVREVGTLDPFAVVRITRFDDPLALSQRPDGLIRSA